MYPADLAFRLEQEVPAVARARDGGSALRAARGPLDAVGQFEGAHTLDEAVGLVRARPPADVVIQRVADPCDQRGVGLSRHGQAELARRAMGGDGDAQPGNERVELGKQRVGNVQCC